jgi:hypothetical protein
MRAKKVFISGHCLPCIGIGCKIDLYIFTAPECLLWDILNSVQLDHEMKQLHRDALDALTSIEIEFANLRDKYVSGQFVKFARIN